jgi:multicomponent Na+:H+ antiporter subunit F
MEQIGVRELILVAQDTTRYGLDLYGEYKLAELIRAITGRLTIDRFIGINMITTTTVLAIGVLSMLLKENYIPDIMIVYVVLSFLALMILCRLYINLHGKKGGPKQ